MATEPHYTLRRINERYDWRSPSTSWRKRHDPNLNFPDPDFYVGPDPVWTAATIQRWEAGLAARNRAA